MSDPIQRFLEARTHAPDEWRALDLSQYESPFAKPLPDAMLPLHGSKWSRLLSETERQGLGREFIRLNAEALIVLEQALLVGMRKHRTARSVRQHADVRQASEKLAWEEYFHTRAFRQFLARERSLRWRERCLFLFRSRLPKRWLAALARSAPTALCLPGAKVEAYSLSYSKHVKDSFGGWDVNSWTKIQHLHVLDEAQHVSTQFALYERSFARGWPAIKLAFGMLVFIVILQILLLTGNWCMVRNAMPDRSGFQRLKWTLRVARWCVREYPAYADARKQMTRLLAQPGLPMGRLFSFMAW